MKNRIEHDSIGEREIPADTYYGVQTLRAIENYPISGVPISKYPRLIQALASIKEAAAMTNKEEGRLAPNLADVIVEAAREVREGKFDDQFPVDLIQGGAGTSSNMNANEVICNRALELLGHKKGQYKYLHPNNHVNMSQSTNDVYPSAAKIATIWCCNEFLNSLTALQDAFQAKSMEFQNVLKMGRTQLQEAVPMTMGQEFKAFADTIGQEVKSIRNMAAQCYPLNMGATAIGTGINTLPAYASRVCQNIAYVTGLPVFRADDLIEATSDTSAFVAVSGAFKRLAIKLTKVCNDLRLLASGPFAGLHEINLPAMAPGSSIMPGKVNPVIPEVVNQVSFLVIGHDVAVTQAASAAQLQLNAFEPVIIYCLFESCRMLGNACTTLKEKCVEGITAEADNCLRMVHASPGLMTAFNPYIGYEASAKIVHEVERTGKSVYELVKESGLLTEEEIAQILSPEMMTHPHALLQKGPEGKKGKKSG